MTNTTNTRPENRLGEPSDGDWEISVSDTEATIQAGASTNPMSANDSLSQPRKSKTPLDRSPTPPRALFRSTTGKGVAFTMQDRSFLISFMEYRK